MPADGFVQVAPDSTGKIIDNSELTVNAKTVERQRIVLADPTGAAGLAAVINFHAIGTEYGIATRIVSARSKILGSYYFEGGRFTVLAAAHASTAGFFWLVNPVGSAVKVYLKKLIVTATPVAATVFVTSPRITVERCTFTGVASGAQVAVAKRATADATAIGTVRTASTGMTLTAGPIIGDYNVPAVLTAVGIAVPYDQFLYEFRDDDDLVTLAAGEGIVVRQADAGSTSDTRLAVVSGQWEEA